MQSGMSVLDLITRISYTIELITKSVNKMHVDIHDLLKQNKQRGDMKRLIRKIVRHFDTEDEFRYAISDYYLVYDNGLSIFRMLEQIIEMLKIYREMDECDDYTMMMFTKRLLESVTFVYLGSMDVRNFIDRYYTEFRYEGMKDVELDANNEKYDEEAARLDKILVRELKEASDEAFEIIRKLERRISANDYSIYDFAALTRLLSCKLLHLDQVRVIHNFESRHFDLFVSKRY